MVRLSILLMRLILQSRLYVLLGLLCVMLLLFLLRMQLLQLRLWRRMLVMHGIWLSLR